MNQYQRGKLNKILIIVAIIMVVIAIIVTSIYIVIKNKSRVEEISYEDAIICKNLFKEIVIDTKTKKILRDNKETTLQEEFGLDAGRVNLILNSTTELTDFFDDSTVEVDIQSEKITLRNPYQTKTILVEAENIKDDFGAEEQNQIQEGIYVLKYKTQKRAKAAYEYLKTQSEIKKVVLDEVMIIDTINDESQTVYGETSENEQSKDRAHGLSAMGINNYKKIITDNGNVSDVVIATIGYGARIEHTYFRDRISEDYYNFISDNPKDIHETISQGSRTLEVIKESTTDNVKILPLVVINDENYTTISSIVQAISYATQKADVICYEFIHKKNPIIELVLRNSFKENVPVCCVTKKINEIEENFPASDGTTIAVSSVDKALKTTSYSANGEYIDFVGSSTDVEEIFNTASSVSKWSGAEYSNAHIASIITLIKSYKKEITILEVYNMIRNYCKDLGDKGKDNIYGYGFPDFSNLKISDIDKDAPNITEIAVDNETWEKAKKIKIKAEDNIKIYGWNVTKTSEAPKDWNKLEGNNTKLEVEYDIKENATYYIWVVDSAGNSKYESREVTKIDNTPPKIQYTIDTSKKDTEKYISINVNVTDNGCGLHEIPYSWDSKENWGTSNKNLRVTENGSYTIYVRDKLENIAEKRIIIKSFPQEGIADIDNGELIKGIRVSANWDGNLNKEVTITFSDNLSIQYWKIVDTVGLPQEFQNTDDSQVQSENTTNQNAINLNSNLQGYSNMTITVELEANRRYYLWVKDENGNAKSQAFSIRKSE